MGSHRATSLSPFETNADHIFYFVLLLSDEINLSCLEHVKFLPLFLSLKYSVRADII